MLDLGLLKIRWGYFFLILAPVGGSKPGETYFLLSIILTSNILLGSAPYPNFYLNIADLLEYEHSCASYLNIY